MTAPTMDDLREAMARAICREKCAFYGDPPCFEVTNDNGEPEPWPNPTCDEPGCFALADAAMLAAAKVTP